MRYPFLEFNTRAISASPIQSPPVRLSRRELEIAALVAEGLTNREIATRLFISERTVDGHLEHVREKLGVNTRAQIATWIVRQGTEAGPAPSISVPIARPESRRKLVAHPRLWTAMALLLAVLAAAVGVLRLTATPEPTIEAFAGSKCAKEKFPGGCFAGDGGYAVNAGLARPSSIAIDSNGLVYIGDYGNEKVRLVEGGTIKTVVGGGSEPLLENAIAASVQLGNTSGVAVDNNNQLYLLTSVDQSLEVWTVTRDGFMSRVVRLGRALGDELTQSLPLGGLAVSKDRTLYVPVIESGNSPMGSCCPMWEPASSANRETEAPHWVPHWLGRSACLSTRRTTFISLTPGTTSSARWTPNPRSSPGSPAAGLLRATRGMAAPPTMRVSASRSELLQALMAR